METELQAGKVRVFVYVEESAKINRQELVDLVQQFHAKVESKLEPTRRIGFDG